MKSSMGRFNNKKSMKKIIPENRAEQLSIQINNGFIMIGGHGESGPLEDIWRYNLESGWSLINISPKTSRSNPLPRLMFAGCDLSKSSNVYIMGGIKQNSDDQNYY